MKKVFTSFLLLALFSINANAGKSTGQSHNFTQPDGTVITVKLLGDEHFSWYQTTDGVLLTRENNIFYIAEVTGSGTMQSTGIVAHNADLRSAEETSKASNQNTTLFFSQPKTTQSQAKSTITATTTDYSKNFCPHSGNVKVPVILMNFPDKKFYLADHSLTSESNTDELKTIIDNYLNSTTKVPYSSSTRFDGYSSVKQYFSEASDEKLNFSFEIFGPYTTTNKHDYYGKKSGNSFSLLTEAIKKADGDIDFSKYDSNNDGNVDLVYVIFAGEGANSSGDNNDFWSSCYYGQNITADNITINTIGGSNEMVSYDPVIRAGVGPLCHEISHGLGLPDLYWTLTTTPKDAQGYDDYNNCGPEYWDLMDGGLNIYGGLWPCQYTAWERDVMGWRNLVELTEPTDITMYPSNSTDLTKAVSYCVTNPENSDEYYTIEYIPYNKWNFYQAQKIGNGLIITHVNNYVLGRDMRPNNTYGHPNVTIVPADEFILAQYSEGKTIQYKGSVVTMPEDTETSSDFTNNYFYEDLKGDPYPGSQNVTSVAAYKNYKGTDMASTFTITDITKNDDGSISFKFRGGTPDGIDAIREVNNNDNRVFTIDGRYVGTSKSYLPAGIYIQNGKKVIIK